MGNNLLREFISDPGRVGSIVDSSLYLAKSLTGYLDLSEYNSVCEIGPGAGPLTGEIIKKLSPEARFACIEKSPDLAAKLMKKYPDITVINDCATNMRERLAEINMLPVDCVISSLPWTLFSGELQTELLDSIVSSLHPDGVFATLVYVTSHISPGAWRFRKKMKEIFKSIDTSPVVLFNMPPGQFYIGRGLVSAK